MDRHSRPEPALWAADRSARRGERLADRRQARTVEVGLSRHCGLPWPAARWRLGRAQVAGLTGALGVLTSAPRPAPPGKISAPRPAPPSGPGLAWASPSPVDPLTCFAQD